MTDSVETLLERYFAELLNQGRFESAEEILCSGFVFYGPLADQGLTIEGLKDFTTALRIAFPDKKFARLDQVREDDSVACRFRMTGTHRGPFQGIPPTGKAISIEGVDFFYLRQNKIAVVRAYFDLMTILVQVGVIPKLSFGQPSRKA